MHMESLENIRKRALELLKKASALDDLERFEIEFFGRKQGKLTEVLRSLSGLADTERRKIGEQANKLRKEIEKKFADKQSELKRKLTAIKLAQEKLDVTFPGGKKDLGHLHPLTLARREAEKNFSSLGYEIIEGPEVDSEHYNFDVLNIPKDHPARDMQDTFWILGRARELADPKKHLLPRTQTSSVQVRYMERNNPPFRIIVPGKVFRNEATDASHEVQFWQLEGMMVGKNISVANLKYTLETFFQKFFGAQKLSVRLRPSYFSFVEPGFEVDISCIQCDGAGCSVCKRSGWVELLGAGMVHQNVFEAAGYVRGEWQGFAFGMGLDRLALMKYGIPDIRMFRSSDIRFLRQF